MASINPDFHPDFSRKLAKKVRDKSGFHPDLSRLLHIEIGEAIPIPIPICQKVGEANLDSPRLLGKVEMALPDPPRPYLVGGSRIED